MSGATLKLAPRLDLRATGALAEAMRAPRVGAATGTRTKTAMI